MHYIDLKPEKREQMMAISNTDCIPQLHVNGRYYGDYEELQNLEDRGDLDFIFENAAALAAQ